MNRTRPAAKATSIRGRIMQQKQKQKGMDNVDDATTRNDVVKGKDLRGAGVGGRRVGSRFDSTRPAKPSAAAAGKENAASSKLTSRVSSGVAAKSSGVNRIAAFEEGEKTDVRRAESDCASPALSTTSNDSSASKKKRPASGRAGNDIAMSGGLAEGDGSAKKAKCEPVIPGNASSADKTGPSVALSAAPTSASAGTSMSQKQQQQRQQQQQQQQPRLGGGKRRGTTAERERDALLIENNSLRSEIAQALEARAVAEVVCDGERRRAADAEERAQQLGARCAEFDELVIERDQLKARCAEFDQFRARVADYDALREKSAAHDALVEKTADYDALKDKCSTFGTVEARCTQLEADVSARDEELSWLREEVERAAERSRAVESLLAESEAERRRLHNAWLELRGNVRVFCRVRPLLPGESQGGDGADGAAGAVDGASPRSTSSATSASSSSSSSSEPAASSAVDFPDAHDAEPRTVALSASNIAPAPGRKKVDKRSWSFTFDRVFSPSSTQADVADEVRHLVQSAVDGYRVCIFAYGQTGSGKTHTMEGADATGEMRGVIPRSIEHVFAECQRLSQRGWRHTLEASYLEIYNETIRDLLAGKGAGKLDLKTERSGEIVVPGLTVVQVSTCEAVAKLLERARRTRASGKTACNEHSSRSHSVFQLRIRGTNEETGEASTDGLLNMIDLAGSERLAKSLADGERLKETQAINKSLSALGDVIASLAAAGSKKRREGGSGGPGGGNVGGSGGSGGGGGHIPYRNSKLTHLLQNSLDRRAKMLMVVNVNPATASMHESLNSLRFASKVNSCEIGQAKRNVSKVSF